MAFPIKDATNMFRAMNANWMSRVFTLSILVIGLYGWLRVTKAKHIKDVVCEQERRELLQALIDIRKDLQSADAIQTNYFYTDSLPKKRNNNQQQQVQKTINRIDSILLKFRVRQDTIIKSKT